MRASSADDRSLIVVPVAPVVLDSVQAWEVPVSLGAVAPCTQLVPLPAGPVVRGSVLGWVRGPVSASVLASARALAWELPVLRRRLRVRRHVLHVRVREAVVVRSTRRPKKAQ